MPIIAYRAKQSTDTSGTGTLVLNAAGSNARSFQAAFGNTSRRVQYCISWETGFEIGLGDFDGGSPGSLTRATILTSSNAGALVTLPAGTKDVFSVIDPAAREVISISATATLALADLGNTVVFSGAAAATLNLPSVATAPLGAGWWVRNGGTASLAIDPTGAETVNGGATLALHPGNAALIYRVGSNWDAILAAPAERAWLDVASAATVNLGAQHADSLRITGTTTITSFGTAPSGVRRRLRIATGLTIVHNAVSLFCPGNADLVLAAGDVLDVDSLGSGNWAVVDVTPASGWRGSAVVIAEAVANNSATLDITTGLDNTYDQYRLELTSLVPATNAVTAWLRVGTGGGPTWQAGAAAYNWHLLTIGTAANITQQGPAQQIGLSNIGAVGNIAGGGISGTIRFCDPDATRFPRFEIHTTTITDAATSQGNVGSGVYLTSTAITGLRFQFSSGNIASGSIRLVGYRK